MEIEILHKGLRRKLANQQYSKLRQFPYEKLFRPQRNQRQTSATSNSNQQAFDLSQEDICQLQNSIQKLSTEIDQLFKENSNLTKQIQKYLKIERVVSNKNLIKAVDQYHSSDGYDLGSFSLRMGRSRKLQSNDECTSNTFNKVEEVHLAIQAIEKQYELIHKQQIYQELSNRLTRSSKNSIAKQIQRGRLLKQNSGRSTTNQSNFLNSRLACNPNIDVILEQKKEMMESILQKTNSLLLMDQKLYAQQWGISGQTSENASDSEWHSQLLSIISDKLNAQIEGITRNKKKSMHSLKVAKEEKMRAWDQLDEAQYLVKQQESILTEMAERRMKRDPSQYIEMRGGEIKNDKQLEAEIEQLKKMCQQVESNIYFQMEVSIKQKIQLRNLIEDQTGKLDECQISNFL